jgi:hypothetical protein
MIESYEDLGLTEGPVTQIEILITDVGGKKIIEYLRR